MEITTNTTEGFLHHKKSKEIIENNPVYGKYYHSQYGFLALLPNNKVYFFNQDIAEDVTDDWDIIQNPY